MININVADDNTVCSWRKLCFYVDSWVCVPVGMYVSEWFTVNVGLRQDGAMATWLFNVYLGGVMRGCLLKG